MVPATYLENLSDSITKMWNFVDGLNDSQQHTKLSTLIDSLVVVTTSLRKSFNSKQLYSILTTMLSLVKKLLPSQVFLKLNILMFLSQISKQFFKNVDKTANPITVICNIFYLLLKNDDVVLRYLTILEFCGLRETAQHEEIFYDSVKSDEFLQNQIERIFVNKNSIKMAEKEVEKILINNFKFKHICGPKINFVEEISCKRIKLDGSDSDDFLIEKILSLANSLTDKQKAGRLTDANRSSLRMVLDILKEIQ